MLRSRAGVLLMGLLVGGGCAGAGGQATIFAGTCLEPLFQCFQPQGTGTCEYLAASAVARLSFPNGAKVESGSAGTQDNRVFGPQGTLCFTVTRITSATSNYSGQGLSVSVTDQGGDVVLGCPSGSQTVPRPASNPAAEDLSRCAPGP